MTIGKDLPKDVIDRWPEVFGEIKLNVVPLRYLRTVKIVFKSGKVWEVDTIKDESRDWTYLENQLKEVISQYEENIDEVDFKLDTDRIKKDMIKSTKKFLKNNKLK